jgi:hypothetical protein
MEDDRIQWPGEESFPDPEDGLGQPIHPMSEAAFGQPEEPPSSITLFLSSQKDPSAFSKPFSFLGNERAGVRV